MRARARTLLDAWPGADTPIMRRLARGGLWSLLGDAGARVLTFAGAVLVARALGATEFGAFALVQSTLGMLGAFALAGMGLTSTRYIAACRDGSPERLGGIIGLTVWLAVGSGLLMALLLLLGAPLIAARGLGAPELTTPLRIVAPALWLMAVSGALQGIVQGFEGFKAQAGLIWTANAVGFVAVVGGTLLGGVTGAVTGLVVGECVRCVLAARLAQGLMHGRGLRLSARPSVAELPILWEFSLPLLLGSILHAPVMWLCQGLIARGPGGTAAIGHYDAAQKWMTIVMLVPFAASAAFAPVFANLHGARDIATLRRTALRLGLLQGVMTAVPAAAVALCAAYAMGIFGPSFAEAARVVPVLMLLAPIFVLKHLSWQALTSAGQAWPAFWIAVLWAVLALFCTDAWRGDGAAGMAWAMVVAYGASGAVSFAVLEWSWQRGPPGSAEMRHGPAADSEAT